MGKLTCFYCGKLGHFQKNCQHFKRDKRNDGSTEQNKISEEKNTSAIVASEEELLFISEQACVNLASDECTWVVDSDTSFHLNPKRECFSSYASGDYGYVMMGNDGSCRIVGIGNVCLLMFIGCKIMLKDVCHVLDVRLNLISIG